MNAAESIAFATFLALLVSPAIPLLVGWVALMKRSTDVPSLIVIALMVLTCSSGLIMSSLFVENILGQHYSKQRLITITVNWVVALLGLLLSIVQRSNRLKAPVFVAAVLLLAVWSLNAALSSVA